MQPKPVEVPKVEARVERPVPVVQPEPKPDPRKKAAASGLLAMSDQLAELRDLDVKTNVDARSLNAGAGETHPRRSLDPHGQGRDGQRRHRGERGQQGVSAAVRRA